MHKFKVFKLVSIPSVLLLWLGSAFYMVGYINDEKWLDHEYKNSAMGFIVCYQRASNYFFLLGSPIVSVYTWSIIVELLTMTMGLIFYLFLIGKHIFIYESFESGVHSNQLNRRNLNRNVLK